MLIQMNCIELNSRYLLTFH